MSGEAVIQDAIVSAEMVEPIDVRCAGFLRNDEGNARRLIERFGRDMLYVDRVGWYVWDGRRFHADSKVMAAARGKATETVAAIWKEAKAAAEAGHVDGKTVDPDWLAAHRSFALKSGDYGRISAMLHQAVHKVYLEDVTELDVNPWLLNVENGTLFLGGNKPGIAPEVRLRQHRREDRISRLAPVRYLPDAKAPVFEAFLEKVLPDPDVRRFLQVWFGYTLTGDISEQCLVILQGQGQNGKSTIMSCIEHVLGDYHGQIPIESLLFNERRGGGDASPDLARLPGIRYATTREPDTNVRLSESKVKQATGGEKLLARNLHQNFFEFLPQFKITIGLNPRPQIRAQDDGIWRRIRLVPFKQKVGKADVGPVKAALEAEGPGILNWLLEGFRIWADEGLVAPTVIADEVAQYRQDSDPLEMFIADCIIINELEVILFRDFSNTFNEWAKINGRRSYSDQALGTMLNSKPGWEATKINNGKRAYRGGSIREGWKDAFSRGRSDEVKIPPAPDDDYGPEGY